MQNQININNHINDITIIGSSKENSIINFDDISSGIKFDNNVKKIKLINLTLYGSLQFEGVASIEIENVILYGALEAKKRNDEYDDTLKLTDFIFYGKNRINDIEACMSLFISTEIKNSVFYGSLSCSKNIILFNGDDILTLKIEGSTFDGDYKVRSINIDRAKQCDILNSTFEKGNNAYSFYGGGYILLL